MPGKRMGSGSRGGSRVRSSRPAARSRSVPRRQTAVRTTRRSVSPSRVSSRAVKRSNTRSRSQSISSRPRPTVRPVSVPKKRMPEARVKAMREVPVRPTRAAPRPSSRDIKQSAKRAVGTAVAVAAAGQLLRLNTAAAAPQVVYLADSLQSSMDELENRAGMSDVWEDVANLDANLSHALSLLESARDKGYMFQADLEDIAYDVMSRWQKVRGNVETNITTQSQQAFSYLNPINQKVSYLNSVLGNASQAETALTQTEQEVRSALNSVAQIERTITATYDDLESQTNQLVSRLTHIHWMLTQRDEASFSWMKDEELYMAVKARWDKEGKDDPEGILYLTTQRLIFERKEKVATKKVLFIAMQKELVQEVLGSQPVDKIENVKAQNKGVFGHQDFLEVDFGQSVVPFHIDGQDSKDWVVWIKNAQAGKLDEDRATGSKLSFADLTGDLTQADILDLQNEINELQDEMMLRASQNELSELENKISTLSRELADLRARGYAVEKSLEADIQVLTAQWEQIKTRSQTTLEYQTGQLGGKMKEIQDGMAKLAGMTGALAAARPVYINLKSLIASAEAQAEAAEETVLDQYEAYADEIEMLDAHLEWVDWMLDALETASFKLLATESGVAAVEAVWERPGLGPENGVLFLTDQRLLWEDRVDDFELKINVPMADVLDVKPQIDEEARTERLVLSLSGAAPLPTVTLLLSQPVAEEWQQMIGRARSGSYDADRAVEISTDELERVRNAPAQCPNCGAAFTAPLLRGQTEIVCEFCGVSTRI